MGVMHADMVMKSIIPIIMAGVLGIYGLIVAVLLGSSSESRPLRPVQTASCLEPLWLAIPGLGVPSQHCHIRARCLRHVPSMVVKHGRLRVAAADFSPPSQTPGNTEKDSPARVLATSRCRGIHRC